MPQIQGTIANLRKQGIADDKIFSYLQTKGVIQTPVPAKSAVGNYDDQAGQNLRDTANQGGQNAIKAISSVSKNAKDAGGSPLAYAASAGSAAGHVAGDIAGTAGGILGSVISPLIPQSVKNGIGDVTKHISDAVDKIPGMTPEIAKSLGDVFNTLSLGIGGGAEAPLGNAVESGTKAVAEAASPVLEKASQAASKVGEGTANIAGKVKEGFLPTMTPSEAAGHVVQGSTEDIPAATRSLSSLDTRGVKTYSDLSDRIKSEISPLAKKVDSELLKNPQNGRSIKSFEQTIGKGASEIKVNYVKQALDQLKAHFQKTNDIQGLSKIQSIENNARIKGMSYKDVNDLARLHGSTINAFNANGEAAAGLTKQAAENTRSGLKEISRSGLGGKEAEALDSKLSDLYDTQRLVEKMKESVNKATQKTAKQGVIPKVIGKAVKGGIKVIDTVTGNPLKSLGKEMGMGVGTSSMSPIEIEQSLSKALRVLRGK